MVSWKEIMVDEKRPGGRFLFLVIGDKHQNLAVRTTKVADRIPKLADGTTKPADRSPKIADSPPQSLPLHNNHHKNTKFHNKSPSFNKGIPPIMSNHIMTFTNSHHNMTILEKKM
jgi:hypothetical protein